MTFTPQVLTQTDNNNSTSSLASSFIGTATITTGFNTLILTIQSNVDSSAGGIQIQFSDDNSSWITPYTDTYFSNNIFTKNYLIIKKYYRIKYYSSALPSNFFITSRLSTDLDSSITQNTSITVFDNNVENTLDAFGKLRVTNPTTLLDIRFPGQNTGSKTFLKNNIQICSDSSGNYTGNYSDSTLRIDASGAGYYISQSRNYCVYQPGKSLLFMASGLLYPGNNAYTTRIGYFNNQYPSGNSLIVYNGLFFQHSGGVYSINVANNGSSTTYNQNIWNIDKMNGTGPSGLNLDFTKTQLFIIDMEWLGIGRIRFGFYAYGRIQYCHQITNINFLLSPYTTSINLPICFSIHNNTNTLTSANNFTQICSTVISEGGYTPVGRPFCIGTDASGVQINGGIQEPLLFLRGNISNTNYYNQNIIPSLLSMICTTNNDLILYKLVLFLAGTYTGTNPTWINVDPSNSVAQYAINPSGYNPTNGIILDQGYFYGKGTNSFDSLGDIFSTQLLQLTSDIKFNSDILVLTATFINNNPSTTTTVYGTLSWQEVY